MTDIACAFRGKTMVKMRIFFFHHSQYILGFICGSIVDDNHLELRIILFQNGWQDFTQVFSLIACAENYGKWRQFS